jgi:hypothetical protein
LRYFPTFALALATAVAGCCADRPTVIGESALETVQRDIQRQIATYAAAAQEPPFTVDAKNQAHPIILAKGPDGKYPVGCGTGQVGFYISSVEATLLTTQDNSVGASGSVKIPVNLVTLTGGAGYSREVNNTQKLTYHLWPIYKPLPIANELGVVTGPVTQDEWNKAPIAQALINLRNALVISSLVNPDGTGVIPHRHQCFTDFNPDKPADDPKNSYQLAITITRDKKFNGGIGVSLANLDATSESKSITGNTLTVQFAQQDLDPTIVRRDYVDSICKKGSWTAACVQAKQEYYDGTLVIKPEQSAADTGPQRPHSKTRKQATNTAVDPHYLRGAALAPV